VQVGVRSINALEVTTVKASHRSALTAAGLAAAFAVTAVPSVASAQRQQAPGPDTKRVLVTTFRGDVEGGVKAADEIRGRVSSDFNIRSLMPTSKKDIDNTLIQSGYKPDSALSPNDIKELAKLVRADEIIDGTVTKTPSGYRVNARLFLPRDAALSQPLLSTESNNLGDVAKQIVREYDAARKQLAANQACENAIRDKKLDVAAGEARKGIAAYPKATLSRLCLASSFQAWKTTADSTKPWADSVIAVTKEVIALDPRSKIAYTLAYDAYKTKNDTANALQSLVGMMNSDPTNTTLRESVIAELVQSGQAQIAIPTAKQLVADNPGDPQYARTYWLVLRAAGNRKEAVQAGEEYVKLDTAAADSNYYFRQIADLGADSAYTKAAEFASAGAAKYPRIASFLVLRAQNERRAGQLPAAKASLERALQVDPKAQGANLLLAQIASDLGDIPAAVKAVKDDAAADPSNKERDAGFLLGLGNTAYRSAVASKKVEDFQKAIDLLKASDEINPSANAAFLTAVSGFSLVQNYGTTLPNTKTCADAKAGQDALVLVNTYMPRGGSVNPDAAKQILGAAPQYQAFFDGSAKKYCK
jgi:tetratricopeptide (TPR) repeat protein